MNDKHRAINTVLVHRLIAAQFPQLKDLIIQPVAVGGWDNRSFRLGEHLLVRMPSAEEYAAQVEKEQLWLPKLAPFLPLPIPEPVAIGEPGEGYPWGWSIYRWLEGDTAAASPMTDLRDVAVSLAQFLIALQTIDSSNGPLPGPQNWYRGGELRTYDTETRQAIALLKGRIEGDLAAKVWEEAIATTWNRSPVWVHGDISAGNLIVRDGRLSSVIDFGTLSVGDPACDLAIAWTFFKGESREVFRSMLPFDSGTWARGRGWALWKALIVAAGLTETNAVEASQPWYTIDELLEARAE